MNKTDEQIKSEAVAAVKRVVDYHWGILLMSRIKPDIRKAFPFGPRATDREKKIWADTVDEELRKLAKFPVALVLLVVLALSVVPHSLAQGNIDRPHLLPSLSSVLTTHKQGVIECSHQ
jgi:hypothetical protein